MGKFDERIERSVSLLDRVRPGWQYQIDKTQLNMAFAGECILGQLYLSYEIGWFRLMQHVGYILDPDEYAFLIVMPPEWTVGDKYEDRIIVAYASLTQEWEEYLSEYKKEHADGAPGKELADAFDGFLPFVWGVESGNSGDVPRLHVLGCPKRPTRQRRGQARNVRPFGCRRSLPRLPAHVGLAGHRESG
jgi:hypothetical protein